MAEEFFTNYSYVWHCIDIQKMSTKDWHRGNDIIMKGYLMVGNIAKEQKKSDF